MIKDLFPILVIVILKVINHLMWEKIQNIKVVNVKRNYLMNSLKNVVEILIELK